MATSTVHVRSTTVIFPSTGTFSSNVPVPCSVMTSVTASPVDLASTRSARPPLATNSSSLPPLRLSDSRTLRPGTRKHTWMQCSRTSCGSMLRPGSNTSRSGQKRTRVPVRLGGTLPVILSVELGLKAPLASIWPGTRSTKHRRWVEPSRSTSATTLDASAFTTEAPTPWRPPEDEYAPVPNLPPAWSSVNTISSAVRLPSFLPIGMPRPLSQTSTEPSLWRVTSIRLAKPAAASSTALSMSSHTRWCSPSGPVPPMYMPGRFRTASRPASSWMLFSS